MAPDLLQTIQIGDWIVEPSSGSITGPDGQSTHLEPKVVDVIVYLAQNAGKVVMRETLLDKVWHGRFNSDQQLTRAISELRRAFEDESADPRYIVTVHKRGYRLVAKVDAADTVVGWQGEARHHTQTHPGWLVGITALAITAVIYFGLTGREQPPIQEELQLSTNSIAVLPFVNMSSDPENQYLSDGISEEILNLLAQMPELKVIGRTSSFAFRNSSEDMRTIGRKLGVRNVLEGSVRQEGEEVRVTAQLIDAADGTHVWSDTFTHTFVDIFELQDEIAAAIAGALQLQVAAIPKRGQPTTSSEAYGFFLRARLAASRLDWRAAVAHLETAVQTDPNFGEAYEFLAYSYWYGAYNGLDPDMARERAYAAASTAIAIDPGLVFAQRLFRSMDTDTSSATPYFDATEWAYRQQPRNPMVLDSLIYNYIYAGYTEKALVTARKYVALDPLSLDANLDLFGALISTGRMDEAMTVLGIVEEITVLRSNWEWTIAGAKLSIGEDESAIQYFESLLHYYGYTDTAWVRELVNAARDPQQGQAILDERIPQIAATLSEDDDFNWRAELTNWYVYLGYVDRYMEIISVIDFKDDPWSYIDEHIWAGHAFYRQGFTVHPGYLDLVSDRGIVNIWDKYGAPDFCIEGNGRWDCSQVPASVNHAAQNAPIEHEILPGDPARAR